MSDKKRLDHKRAWQTIFWQAVVVFIISFVIRFIGGSVTPIQTDELYHLLASQSWVVNGSFKILDGDYNRAGGFTVLIGLVSKMLGSDTMLVARVPSMVFGALLITLLFVWLSNIADRKVAWAGTLLFFLAHFVIDISQFARFYALHALLILLASVIVYSIIAEQRSYWRLLLAGIAIVIAFHLQITTAIALMALVVWVLIDLACHYGHPILQNKKHWLWLIMLGISSLFIAYFAVGNLLDQFRYAPLWAVPAKNNVLFYYSDFRLRMPILWQLFPLAFIAALVRWPRPAFFCIIMFTVPMVIHSLGAMKSMRYVYYIWPYFFAIWGMATSVVLPAIFGVTKQGISALTNSLRVNISGSLGDNAAIVSSVAIVTIALLGNSVYTDALREVGHNLKRVAYNPSFGMESPPDKPWTGQVTTLRESIRETSILVTADDLRTIRYLRPYDVLLNASVLSDVKTWKDFEVDFRTGRPVIASADAIEKVIQCYPDGVILVPESRWRVPTGVTSQAADAIEKMTVPLFSVTGFRIFKWKTPNAPDSCIGFRNTLKEKIHG
ncbi:MAG TPA: glycosyltransferase family 39 protein [Methylophilaceae bacterium]|nr:glycosyltransferase family 39 protein [Methylophilaceae bacterium]